MEKQAYLLFAADRYSFNYTNVAVTPVLQKLKVGLNVYIEADFCNTIDKIDLPMLGLAKFYTKIIEINGNKLKVVLEEDILPNMLLKGDILEINYNNILRITGDNNWIVENLFGYMSEDITINKNRIDLIVVKNYKNCVLDSGIECYSVKESLTKDIHDFFEYMPLRDIIAEEPQILDILKADEPYYMYIKENGKFRGLTDQEIIKEYSMFTKYDLTSYDKDKKVFNLFEFGGLDDDEDYDEDFDDDENDEFEEE